MSGYTLKLDLDTYQTAVLRTLLDQDLQRAERDGIDPSAPWPTAVRVVVEQIDSYITAREAARAVAEQDSTKDGQS